MLLALGTSTVKVFASTDSSTFAYGNIGADIVAKLKATTVVVFTIAVPVTLMLIGRSMVRHWNIALTRDVRSDRRHVFHRCVGVRVVSS